MRTLRSLVIAVGFVGVALLMAAPAQAQKKAPKEPGSAFIRTNPKFLAAFREIVAPVSQSTVRILCDGKETALGMVVDGDGWILTKLNDLKGEVTCRLRDGKVYDAKVVGVHKQNDLAMLKIKATNLTPVRFSDTKSVPVGNWVAAPGTGEDPVAIGVVSVATRDLPNKGGPTSLPTVQIGVGLEPSEMGVKIIQVMPKTPAAEIGLKVNDIILSVEDKTANEPDAFIELMTKYKVGDVVTLKIKRGEEELAFQAKLAKRPPNRGDMQNSMGSELSSRRSGYPTILQHDSISRPADCGGPLVDLEGNVLGINICRAGRTESWAVPSEVVRPLLADLRSGKLAPPPDQFKVFTLDEKLERAQASIRKAQEDLGKLRDNLKKSEAERAKLDQTIRTFQQQITGTESTLRQLQATLDELKRLKEKDGEK